MKLGSRGKYAVMAMVDLVLACESSSPVRLKEIAARQGLSLLYLEQLFACLKKHGFVSSMRGQKGGYTLVKRPRDIRILDILQAVGEEMKATRCAGGDGCLPDKTRCLTHLLWAGLEDHMSAYLASVSLEDICAKKRGCYSLKKIKTDQEEVSRL